MAAKSKHMLELKNHFPRFVKQTLQTFLDQSNKVVEN